MPITTLEQARKQKYGRYEKPYVEGRCCKDVWERGLNFQSKFQCKRADSDGRAGLYCKHHDPEDVQARQAKRDAAWQRQMDASARRSQLTACAGEMRAILCELVALYIANPDTKHEFVVCIS